MLLADKALSSLTLLPTRKKRLILNYATSLENLMAETYLPLEANMADAMLMFKAQQLLKVYSNQSFVFVFKMAFVK